jgi:uncharacterized surface protein with fasciclin (FAS1) repeats
MQIRVVVALLAASAAIACDRGSPAPQEPAGAQPPSSHAPASNQPPLDPDNIVSIASRSPDHTTLVAAIQAADYVTSVAASGPFTVFAPTNEAFQKLPPGTLDSLLEPANADALRKVLQYHVTTSAYTAASLRDGQVLGMANGAKTTVHRDADVVSINDARVLASIPASNGIVHVIDRVLVPPQ